MLITFDQLQRSNLGLQMSDRNFQSLLIKQDGAERPSVPENPWYFNVSSMKEEIVFNVK
jgi:hypothetical protein